ncbi:MAG: hypothetical protein E3K37_01140 [Candidatus Kuenenia sp.]|nr:hypothetical protein [Candidatus Kuenenia hertensis]
MDKTEQGEVVEITQERDKAIRLFTYLKELCALRTTQRNGANYDQVFWLNELPRHNANRVVVRCSMEVKVKGAKGALVRRYRAHDTIHENY